MKNPGLRFGAWCACLLFAGGAMATPPSAAARARLAAGQTLQVIVEYDARAANQSALQERSRRGLQRDDAAIRGLRAQGFARVKAGVDAAASGPGAARLRDFPSLPLTLWRVDSAAALARIESLPGVRAVHEDRLLRVNSVSDLPFIHQPEAAAEGATGAGTVVAVIDGGLGTNYKTIADFGPCAAVGLPAATCRVVYNQDYYSGSQASHETTHGTNVSAISLGVAPGAKLAMFDVFGWFFDPGSGTFVSGAFNSDILNALNHVYSNPEAFNYAAVNMSLGDGSAHAAACTDSVYASVIGLLTSAGVHTVVAAGNNGNKNGLADPACAPGVVSVGAVYSASHSAVTWSAPASCTESGTADQVACFSQSANYLTVLSPGLFVDAPNSSFQQSGTSQAAPHVAGALAVLRARYPHEPLGQGVQRLRDTGHPTADALAGGRVLPRLELLAALHESARLDLGAVGPDTAVNGQTADYQLAINNSGQLIGTMLSVKLTLPPGTTILAMSAGCTAAGAVVTCVQSSLNPGTQVVFTVQVRWNFSGPVTGNVALTSEQINSAPDQQVNLGQGDGGAPLPPWALVLLGAALLSMLLTRQARVPFAAASTTTRRL